MLAYMQEHQTVFSLKELEKLLPKATGIISQSIKDVLKMLCDDDLVEFDKIGSGNFYWALPSKAVAKKRARVSQLEAKLQRLSQDEKALEKRKEVAEKDRQPTEERKAKLRKVRNLKCVLMAFLSAWTCRCLCNNVSCFVGKLKRLLTRSLPSTKKTTLCLLRN